MHHVSQRVALQGDIRSERMSLVCNSEEQHPRSSSTCCCINMRQTAVREPHAVDCRGQLSRPCKSRQRPGPCPLGAALLQLRLLLVPLCLPCLQQRIVYLKSCKAVLREVARHVSRPTLTLSTSSLHSVSWVVEAADEHASIRMHVAADARLQHGDQSMPHHQVIDIVLAVHGADTGFGKHQLMAAQVV